MATTKDSELPTFSLISAKTPDLQFLRDEYAALRQEILARLDELWKIEKHSFIGAAAIATWLMTHPVNNKAAVRLPFVFLTISCWRFAAGMWHLGKRVSPYTSNLEKIFLGEKGGWQTWFNKQGPNETIAYSFAWATALLFALIFALTSPTVTVMEKLSAPITQIESLHQSK
jgi:hypothetical protein